jgi:hypothetical protein
MDRLDGCGTQAAGVSSRIPGTVAQRWSTHSAQGRAPDSLLRLVLEQGPRHAPQQRQFFEELLSGLFVVFHLALAEDADRIGSALLNHRTRSGSLLGSEVGGKFIAPTSSSPPLMRDENQNGRL